MHDIDDQQASALAAALATALEPAPQAGFSDAAITAAGRARLRRRRAGAVAGAAAAVLVATGLGSLVLTPGDPAPRPERSVVAAEAPLGFTVETWMNDLQPISFPDSGGMVPIAPGWTATQVVDDPLGGRPFLSPDQTAQGRWTDLHSTATVLRKGATVRWVLVASQRIDIPGGKIIGDTTIVDPATTSLPDFASWLRVTSDLWTLHGSRHLVEQAADGRLTPRDGVRVEEQRVVSPSAGEDGPVTLAHLVVRNDPDTHLWVVVTRDGEGTLANVPAPYSTGNGTTMEQFAAAVADSPEARTGLVEVSEQ